MRIKPVCQNQSGTSDKYAFCGLYSINNALQIRDFLTPALMADNVRELKELEPNVDNGHAKYGGYSINSIQRAIRKKGYQLRYLNEVKTFKNVSKKHWFARVAQSKIQHMIIIGIMHGAQEGSYHCIARAQIQNTFFCIDSDVYSYWKSTETALRTYFLTIVAIYEVVHVCK
jgi:hypothetical protein